MEFTYKKNNNIELFNSFRHLDISFCQNYIPIYNTFFNFLDVKSKSINLNTDNTLHNVIKKHSENIYNCIIKSNKNKSIQKDVFFKFSPILEPSKFIIEKYDISYSNIEKYLPSEIETTNYEFNHYKIQCPNNSAYVDSFFTYLTSKVLHHHNFCHSLDFYGSFIGIKNNFKYDISDEIEYLMEHKNFHKNNGILFEINDLTSDFIFNSDTRNNKERLVMDEFINANDNIKYLSDIESIKCLDEVLVTNTSTNNIIDISDVNIIDISLNCSNSICDESTTSDCSSRSSHTSHNDVECVNDDSLSYETDTSCYSTATEDEIIANIYKFPVHVISLEKCVDTLDNYILTSYDNISGDEWGSIIMQILMTLITYQKMFKLTHNDLHTNNIMYINTKQKFIYYKYDNIFYKVPTYGKIYKIIDFGRAIYKFKGNVICSDSYHKHGDAATMYNFEPFYNDEKPRIEPNYSFDLCRLGCALYEYIIDDVEEYPEAKRNQAKKIITEWCFDDKNRNILYKNNGEERYPDFKLYKMITRTVHNHTPENVLKNPFFYRYKSKNNKKIKNIMNIDEYPTYY